MIKSITGLTIGIDNIRRALALLKEGKIEDASSLIEDAATLLTGIRFAFRNRGTNGKAGLVAALP